MSDDYEIGRGRPPKHTQFPKGRSGNPKGRPRKPRRALIPSQLRRDTIAVMELPVRIRTAQGDRIVTLLEATIYALGNQAVNGKASYMKEWMRLIDRTLWQNEIVHPEYKAIDGWVADFEARGQAIPPGIQKYLDVLASKSRKPR